MSNSNKNARRRLEQIYGKGCFFTRAEIAKRIEDMGGIRTYKTFIKEKHYKGHKISHQITYHHLRHRSEGGDTSVENGANVEEIAHQYMHSLPREHEEIINNMLREFKVNCITMQGNGKPEAAAVFQIEENTDFMEIPLYDMETLPEYHKKAYRQKKRYKDTKSMKYRKAKNPSREEVKRRTQKEIEDYERE